MKNQFNNEDRNLIKTLIEQYDSFLEDCLIENIVPHAEYIENVHENEELLAASIKRFGQIKPLIGWRLLDGRIEIIKGHRVYNAALLAGLNKISVLVLRKIEPEEVQLIMQLLNSYGKKYKFSLMAERFESVKLNAKALLIENKISDSSESDNEVRKYLSVVFGMNEHYISDFEHILASPDKQAILQMLDTREIKFHRAVKMAKKSLSIGSGEHVFLPEPLDIAGGNVPGVVYNHTSALNEATSVPLNLKFDIDGQQWILNKESLSSTDGINENVTYSFIEKRHKKTKEVDSVNWVYNIGDIGSISLSMDAKTLEYLTSQNQKEHEKGN